MPRLGCWRRPWWPAIGVLIFLAPMHASAQEPDSVRTPRVSALVRVVVPRLGPEWHVGMFNRIRVEPPCYVVLLFSSDGRYRVSETLALAEAERLQVHRLYDNQFPLRETWESVAGPEYWLDAPLDSLKRQNEEHCPSDD